MKHLRKFEGYLDKYWWEIDQSEFNSNQEQPWKSAAGLTQFEIDFIKGNIKPYRYCDLKFNTTCFEVGFDSSVGLSPKKSIRICTDVYFFQKIKDDWWLVQEMIYSDDVKISFYKCDQWEGFVRFLKDKKLLK